MRRANARDVVAVVVMAAAPAFAQKAAPTDPAVIASIHRLVLTDGSFQTVRRYEVRGDRIRYISAERAGDWEELPSAMVDWAATVKYAREHTPQGRAESGASADAKALDAEEAQEKAEQTSRTPLVVPGLLLPDRDGVWVLDYFQNQPELVTLVQNSGDVNQQTGHNVMRAAINPLASRRQEVRLDGEKSKVRLHEPQPEIFISLSGAEALPASDAVPVDTHGAKTEQAMSSPDSQYAIVRLDVRRNYRVVTTINLSALGRLSQSQDVVATTTTILPGKHWMKVVPKQPLTIGEYALIEVLNPKDINLSVWDFRIDPAAGDNANAILPLQRPR